MAFKSLRITAATVKIDTKIIIKMAQMGKMGKKLDSLIALLRDPKEEKELRFKIKQADFRACGEGVIEALEAKYNAELRS